MKQETMIHCWLPALACTFVVGLLLAAPPAGAQLPPLVCPDCELLPKSICSEQGFEITLKDFKIDQLAGTSFWDYEVCNDKDKEGECTPPHDLSHVNIELPGLGTCLTATQTITFQQIGGFANATLDECGVTEKDKSCKVSGTQGTDFVAKCDVAGGSNLDQGECVVVRLSIAGEKPTLGAGAASTRTKASDECGLDCILGPSCQACAQPPDPPDDACLTRTPGFWGNHPHITSKFLPVTVCGKVLSKVEATSCNSVTEAMCVAPGKESKGNEAYAQLVRQLAAAKLNLAATAANGGSCDPAIDILIGDCELLCGANQATISGSGCIKDLTAFNESLDTFPSTPPPFDSPGQANPSECRKANGNGLVIGKGACS